MTTFPATLDCARWVGGGVVLAAMLLGLGAAADAKDCTRATPLPIDMTITTPAADVSADFAKFSAAWGGVWTPRPGDDGPCSTLVVEDVFPNGFVRVMDRLPLDAHARAPRGPLSRPTPTPASRD